MNIVLKKIDRTNYCDCINLKLNKEQEGFVAPNMFSLVQAAYEPNMYPLGIYKNNKMVGFILYDFDDEINGWSMSRFMVDKNYQNQGIGSVALKKFLEFFKEKIGHNQLYTSAEINNLVATSLYEKMGFIKKENFQYNVDETTYNETRMVIQL